MATRMITCCTTALLSRAIVAPRTFSRPLAISFRLSASDASWHGTGIRDERVRALRLHRNLYSRACASAGAENASAGNEVQIQLYNTMKKQKEVFQPIVPGKVSMYVCGVTTYDYSHIGHARVYVAFDVLFR